MGYIGLSYRMPIGIICQALGHSSIRVTETYLKPFENEKVDKANRKLISTVKKHEGGVEDALFIIKHDVTVELLTK